jgi:beta-lactamase class A
MWFEKAKKLISAVEGEVGFLVKNLATGETFAHNADAVFPSASIIKVPILAALLDAAAEGRLDINAISAVSPSDIVGGCGVIQILSEKLPLTILDHATLMIALSDNTATNQLISIIGMDNINAKCRELGLKDTVLGRKLMDFEAKKQGKDNFTSCADMLILFEKMHNNPEQYALALKLLKQQLLNDLLPAYTGFKFDFAHKTGELGGVRHDVGIMYLDVPVFAAFLTKNLAKDLDGVRLANDIGILLCQEFKAS